MKKIIATFLYVVLFTIAGNAQETPKKDTLQKKQAIVQYTCTMHPDVISDKPGNCPKCGMTLVPIDTKKNKKKSKKNKKMGCMGMMNM
ncbi:heavy metal-binding domain-containing protein [Hydrotalea sp.]|uniref:heavy metal-binding domain-containing protein n=1 Tax=Hydrotalea sp. TaxID=2881279 RepID=UPI002614C52A|nr:heavy metal-binding domain-containing protein [Hydrotalea sp.]